MHRDLLLLPQADCVSQQPLNFCWCAEYHPRLLAGQAASEGRAGTEGAGGQLGIGCELVSSPQKQTKPRTLITLCICVHFVCPSAPYSTHQLCIHPRCRPCLVGRWLAARCHPPACALSRLVRPASSDGENLQMVSGALLDWPCCNSWYIPVIARELVWAGRAGGRAAAGGGGWRQLAPAAGQLCESATLAATEY